MTVHISDTNQTEKIKTTNNKPHKNKQELAHTPGHTWDEQKNKKNLTVCLA